ncbi:MAG TPA: hypothetical protein VE954_13560 [Oligoflexus sp.]|uniref:hypothetical protein n=1 Tax=Oligoflexus sp. TaxID=1971216 RepID=UPI002D426F51|nr:hypothetical protein [Oligoflexus sp.]HYX34130.1 hypothetical protein [Oligoflexus sp.]
MIEHTAPDREPLASAVNGGVAMPENSSGNATAVHFDGMELVPSPQELAGDVAGVMSFGLRAYIDMQAGAFGKDCHNSFIFARLMNLNPSTAVEVFEQMLKKRMRSVTGPILQQVSQLSNTPLTITRWQSISVACEMSVMKGGTSVDVYRKYGLDEDEGPKLKNRGIKMQNYFAHKILGQDLDDIIDTVNIHGSLLSHFRIFKYPTLLVYALDRIKNADHLYHLLENGLVRFQGDRKTYAELTVKQANALTKRLSKDPGFWGELMGREGYDDPDDPVDPGADDQRKNTDSDGKDASSCRQGNRRRSTSLEEFFHVVSKVERSGKTHFKHYQEFVKCVKSLDLPDNEADAMKVDYALQEFVKGFGALFHLYETIQCRCDSISVTAGDKWQNFKKSA